MQLTDIRDLIETARNSMKPNQFATQASYFRARNSIDEAIVVIDQALEDVTRFHNGEDYRRPATWQEHERARAGERILPGQLPNETAAECQDRRARDLIGDPTCDERPGPGYRYRDYPMQG